MCVGLAREQDLFEVAGVRGQQRPAGKAMGLPTGGALLSGSALEGELYSHTA